ncbi:RHS repeat domain-containing protein [Pedobacter sp. MW01-1-1]|uniref:RHS repeat domain-containing protein n=1 Tax=Pedobacter sp. MW01-1-1 TaxID=3383027 RepID=UPI003FED9F6C
MALYDNAAGTNNWREQTLYGSSRLGIWKPNINLASQNGGSVWDQTGKIAYELSNHLGNTMATISDNRLQVSGGYKADVLTASDYYAFGMAMSERSFTASGATAYRYGFNGKENDNEVKGAGNQQDYGMRIYDPRIGRFLSVDPLVKDYAYYTPYSFAGNMPIEAIDLDGLEPYKNGYKFAYKSDPTLNLFHADNLVDMSGATNPTSYNSLGWPRDAPYFWNKFKDTPLGQKSLSKDNLARIAINKSLS